MFDMVTLEFLAQGAAVDAEAGSGPRLVIVAVPQHGFQHGLLDLGDYRVEEITGYFAVQIAEIRADRFFYRLL